MRFLRSSKATSFAARTLVISIGMKIHNASLVACLIIMAATNVIKGQTTFNGTTDSDWSTASNWSTGSVPGTSANISIASGVTATIDGNTNITVASLQIQNNAVLNIESGSSLTNNGFFLLNSGANLNVKNDAAFITGSLTNFGGDCNVTRTIPAGGGTSFRFMGSPVTSENASDIVTFTQGTDDAQITSEATCDPSQIASGSEYSEMLYMDESASSTNNCSQELWHVFGGSTNPSRTLTPGMGYSVMTNSGTSHTFQGEINTGSVSVAGLGRAAGTIGLPGGLSTSTRGWHLLSNPYPSPIQLTSGNLPSGFDSQIQLWDVNNSNWVSVDLSSTNADIAVAQAFQVRVTTVGNSETFTFTSAMQTTGTPTFYSNPLDSVYHLNLELETTAGLENHYITFRSFATEGVDAKGDVSLLQGTHTGTYLYGVSTNQEGYDEELSYNALPVQKLQEEGYTIPVHLQSPLQETGKLRVHGLETLPQGVFFYITDEQTQTEYQIIEGLEIPVAIQGQEKGHRFTLRVSSQDLGFGQNSSGGQGFRVSSDGHNLSIFAEQMQMLKKVSDIKVYDTMGRLLFHRDSPNGYTQNPRLNLERALPKGVYILSLEGSNGVISTTKFVVS